MINPFSTKFPVSPNYFINREKELSAFKEALEASFDKHPPRPENLAILGDWGVGKTSILTKFQDIALNECKVGCFDLEETKKAILTPLRVGGIPVDIGKDVIERIFSLTQGHPYFISFVMHDLLQKRSRGRIDIPFFDRVFDNILSRLHRIKFEMDYGIASDGEKRILKALANSENERVKIMELKIAGLKRSSLSKTMERLIEKDLLVKAERGEYALYHPLFKQFLLKK